MQGSLKILGIGQVLEDNTNGSHYVRAILLAHAMLLDGDLVATKDIQMDVTDDKGKVKQIKETIDYGITAKWLPLNTPNRYSPPNCYRGQKVIILCFEGFDEYFYMTLFSEHDIRKQEEVTFLISNKNNLNDTTKDILEATYRFTLSSIAKQLHFKSSKDSSAGDNAEKVIYEFLMDFLKGKVFLSDDKNNIIFLDSDAGKLLTYIIANINYFIGQDRNTNITNNDNILINNNKNTIIKQNELVKIEGDYLSEIKGSINTILDKFTLVSKSEIVIISKGSMHIEARKGLKLTGSTESITIFSGKQIDITAPMVNLNTPALSVPGVITCGGLSMGGAKPGDVNPPIVKPDAPDLSSLEELEKNIIEETKNPNEEKKEEEKEEEEKKEEEKEEEEKDPETPSTDPSSKDCSLETEGEITINSKTGSVTVKANGDVIINGGSNITINGTGKVEILGRGMNIGTNTKSLDDVLNDIVTSLQTLFTMTGSCMNGPATNAAPLTAGLPTEITKLTTAIQQLKGV